MIDIALPKRGLKNVDLKTRQEIRHDFRQPVSTSGKQKGVRLPTHNQGVVGVCPTGPTLKIKHLQDRLVSVFCFAPGRRQDLGNLAGFVQIFFALMFVYF
ncbi:MAG: hypothetical protein WCI31_14460 [Prolixibacteraceae bacterium]